MFVFLKICHYVGKNNVKLTKTLFFCLSHVKNSKVQRYHLPHEISKKNVN